MNPTPMTRKVAPSAASPWVTARVQGATLRVVVADDSYLIREAVTRILASEPEVDVVGECGDGETLLELVAEQQPDVVVTDVRMPPRGDDEGIRVANQLRTMAPRTGLVVLSQFGEPRYALDLLSGGAEGRAYLLKERIHDRSELLQAIRVVATGGSVIDPTLVRSLIENGTRLRHSRLSDLTPRERDVIVEMAQGKSNAAIATSLVVTKRAVEKHVGAIFAKLGLEDEDAVSRRVMVVLLFLAEAES
ncbi:MAG: response regulator [Candidatus Limnocylindrales bacterium]